jgi:hypothetical protein
MVTTSFGDDQASICSSGHVINLYRRQRPNDSKSFCKRCGSPALDGCPACGRAFPNQAHVEFEVPEYCDDCGAALPWSAPDPESVPRRKPDAGDAQATAASGASGIRYDVALSFAGEERDKVRQVAECLKGRGVRVFYDEFESTELWGKDLQEHFVNVYMRQSRYAVIFVSAAYRDKQWTRHELRSALARALTEREEYVLPVRLDDAELEGLLPTVAYLDLRRETPTAICVRLCQKLGLKPAKANTVPSPKSRGAQGSVRFDYSSHDGRYRIGTGPYEFETEWSRGSDTSIYCLIDPPSIRGVALAAAGAIVSEIRDATALDFTSRARTARVGQVVVLENANGYFAALRVKDIKDSTRYDGPDALEFDYWILGDGGADFSAITPEAGELERRPSDDPHPSLESAEDARGLFERGRKLIGLFASMSPPFAPGPWTEATLAFQDWVDDMRRLADKQGTDRPKPPLSLTRRLALPDPPSDGSIPPAVAMNIEYQRRARELLAWLAELAA